MVVDYAERWRLAVLVQMVENLNLDYPDRLVRVLLLSRTAARTWDTIVAELARGRTDLVDPLELGELAHARSAREAAYASAAAAFASQMDATPPLPEPPADLMDSAYQSPLTLHMAALAALQAVAEGEAPPATRDLSRYLLEHERRHWTASEGAVPGGGGLPAGVMEQFVFLATLCGPLGGVTAGRALLRQARLAADDAEAGRILAAHERLYPAVAAGETGASRSSTVLMPLRPDRLGEDLIGHLLARDAAAGQMLDDLLDDSSAALAAFPSALRRALTVLAAAAARHPAAQTALSTCSAGDRISQATRRARWWS
jgi:hypothetical protein